MRHNKTEADKIGWKLLHTKRLHDSPLVRLRQDRLLAGDHEHSYTYLERTPSVIIVPVTQDGEIILIRQYRYPLDEWHIEVPAGGTHDTGDAHWEDVVRKELLEEIGGTCESLTYVNHFSASPSMSDELCHVYLARGVVMSAAPIREPTEAIEILPTPIAEALRMAHQGEIKVAPSALAILLCEPLLVPWRG